MSDFEKNSSSPRTPPRHRASSHARKALEIYREMGPERSPKRLADQLKRDISQIEGWCRTHHWDEQCAAYDVQQAQIRLEEDRRSQTMTDQMWEQREREMNEGVYQQGQKAAEQGNLMFNFPLVDVQRAVKKDENGVTVEIQNIKAARWSKRDALRFLEFANERKQAAIDAARKSSGTKDVDIFEDLPYESAKKGRP